MTARLGRGELLPRLLFPPPGPRSHALSAELERLEPPGVNTRYRGEPALLWQAARGSNVLDVDGNRFIDLTSGFGVAAIGHRHPRVVTAVRRQAGELLHGLGDVHAHPSRVALAAELVALAPMPDAQACFAISGADAVETAVATALLATRKSGVLAFLGGYHGLTFGALALGSRPAFRAPFLSALNPNVRPLPFGCPAADLERELARGDLALVVVEPILGREGVVPPPPGWLDELAARCRRHGVLLALDEILTGGGRTGSFWACTPELRGRPEGPDLLCCGKALGGGMPLAAVLGRRELMAAWRPPGEALRTATFLAHPLACASALATLQVIAEEGLVARAAGLGPVLAQRLEAWPGRYPRLVRAVRGRGAWWGVELSSARYAAGLVAGALARGVLVLAGGPEGTVAQLVPALNITDRQLGCALRLLEATLDELDRGHGREAHPVESRPVTHDARLKLAFIGTHGVGKTTLCYGLAARLKARDVVLDVVHEVARRCPLPVNQETSLAAESWIIHTQIAEEAIASARHPVVICDRSALDNYVYLLLAAGRQPALEAFVDYWLGTYDLLVHVPILELPSADGYRAVDPGFQRAVEERLAQELERRTLGLLALDPARRMSWLDDVEACVWSRLRPAQLSLI